MSHRLQARRGAWLCLHDPWISGEVRLELVMLVDMGGDSVSSQAGAEGLPALPPRHTPLLLPLAQHDGLQQLFQGLPAAPAASGVGGVFLPRTRLLDSLPWPTNKPTHSLPEGRQGHPCRGSEGQAARSPRTDPRYC